MPEIPLSLLQISFCCFIASCPEIRPPFHGSCDPCVGSEGDTVEFSCDEGYQLTGAASTVCLNTTQWTNHPPQCTGES